MDNPKFSPGKRPFSGDMHYSTEDHQDEFIKRRKLSEIPRSLGERNRNSEISFQQPFSAPVLHSVPPSILPIIYPPLQTKDFFTDVTTDLTDPNLSKQIKGILQNFPPPIPPYLPNDVSPPQGGMMIPFIFPPPPIIKSNQGVSHIGQVIPDDEKSYSAQVQESYVELPPLPFPPPNYMPYPLISDRSSLTPSDVFTSFLEALQKLPRIDMVLASAAGSLFDLRIQATEEGFTFEKYELLKSKKLEALKYKKKFGHTMEEEENEELDSDDFEEYYDYASNIDRTDAFDKHSKLFNFANDFGSVHGYPPEYLRITPNVSDIKNPHKKQNINKVINDEYSMDKLLSFRPMLPVNSNKIISNFNKDISSANGMNKEKRRKDLEASVGELSRFESKNRLDVYLTKKQHLLLRLQCLRESEVKFLCSDSDIKDQQLLSYKRILEERRDEELVRLKLKYNYEYLKNLLVFYQDSNKVYKLVNTVIVNKLMKLKNFFEFQKNLFEDSLNTGDPKESLFDVKSKESSKLFNGISERDFNTEIKQIINSTKRERETLNISNAPIVHDCMPLISAKEFDIITGSLPNKGKQSKDFSKSGTSKAFDNIRHHIFQSSLYDSITSGSDTNNASESTAGTPSKRRGRRGGNNTPSDKLIDENKSSSKYTESLLLAKIMKHFVEPQGANADELNDDLETMGVKTRWPIQYTK